MIRLGVLQFDPQNRTVEENISYIIAKAADIRHALIALPELFLSSYYNYTFVNQKELSDVLWPLIQLARRNDLAFVGSLPVRHRRRFFNRGVYITAQSILHKDKRYLWSEESRQMSVGRRNPLFYYQEVPFCIQVCSDIIDPTTAARAVTKGAKIVINPMTTNNDFLRQLNAQRARYYGVVSVCCNRSGYEENGQQYAGKSAIFLPTGRTFAVSDTHSLHVISLTLSHIFENKGYCAFVTGER